jgi:hypothetical protein
MYSWKRVRGKKIKRIERNNVPDLTEWLEEEADVKVNKFEGKVPYIEIAYPPETYLVKEDDFTYHKKGINPQLLLND